MRRDFGEEVKQEALFDLWDVRRGVSRSIQALRTDSLSSSRDTVLMSLETSRGTSRSTVDLMSTYFVAFSVDLSESRSSATVYIYKRHHAY